MVSSLFFNALFFLSGPLVKFIEAVGIISLTLENASLLNGGSLQLANVGCESSNLIPLMINKLYDLIIRQFLFQQEIKCNH